MLQDLKIKDLEAENEKLKTETTKSMQRIKELERKVADCKDLEAKHLSLQNEFAALLKDLKESQGSKQELEAQNTQLQVELADALALIKEFQAQNKQPQKVISIVQSMKSACFMYVRSCSIKMKSLSITRLSLTKAI